MLVVTSRITEAELDGSAKQKVQKWSEWVTFGGAEMELDLQVWGSGAECDSRKGTV
jgi:hypothetical protein